MRSPTARVLSEGLVAGLVGYVAVALSVLASDLVTGRPAFFTPALLGNALFYGIRDPARLSIWPGPVLSYNGFHLLVFLALGFLVAWLADLSERGPQFWYLGLTILLVIAFHMLGFALGMMVTMQGGLSPWLALGAGMFAAAAMAGYLLAMHPKLRQELRTYRDEA